MEKKANDKVGLFIWSGSEPYWGGWQGFVGVFNGKGKAIAQLHSNKSDNKAQLVDFSTLKVISNFDKRDGRWKESTRGR